MDQPISKSRWVFFDVGNLISYVSNHPSVSGIQRVLIELWKVLSQSTHLEVIPVCFDDDAKHFVKVSKEKLNELIDLLDAKGVEGQIAQSARSLYTCSLSNGGLQVSGGEVLIAAGTAWGHPWYFHGVNDLKSQNVRVLTLVYDLIPILFQSFPIEVRISFMRYLFQTIMLSDSISTISHHTRKDLDEFAIRNGLIAATGPVTQLPGGFTEKALAESSSDHTMSKNYILMVGTIEERKNHLVALNAYKKLVATLGIDETPDLICAGRLGWNISDFLDELSREPLVQQKVKLLTEGLNDMDLASLYRGALFTIYPSKYEGWGLPVSESLDFGVPVITTWASSLPEAGGEFSAYVEPDNHHDLAEKMLLWIQNPELLSIERNRLENRQSLSWDQVGTILLDEIENTSTDAPKQFVPSLKSGIEYGFGSFPRIDERSGSTYLQEMRSLRSMTMTNSLSNVKELVLGEFAIKGPYGNRDDKGITYTSDSNEMLISLNFIRNETGALNILVATEMGYQKLHVTVNNSGDTSHQIFSIGSVLSFRLSAKPKGSQEIIKIRFEKLSKEVRDKLKITFKSILIIDETDIDTELQVIRARLNAQANEAGRLRENYAQAMHQGLVSRIVALESSVSWKLTGPFRYVVRTWKRIIFRS